MAAEEDFVLSFTGEETDNLLKHTESIKNQTTADDGETVQVYDTNGVPHKVSKTELLKKSTLALPALEDISSFVAINAAGNAVGVMTKDQVASVLAGLIGTVTALKDGLMSKSGFIEKGDISDANTLFSGFLRTYGTPNTPYPSEQGVLVSISTSSVCLQFFLRSWPFELYWRGFWNNWNSWNRIG